MTSPDSSIIMNLSARLEAHGVEVDVRRVAAVILETARELNWSHDPAGVVPWLQQLAIEVAQTSPANLKIRRPK